MGLGARARHLRSGASLPAAPLPLSRPPCELHGDIGVPAGSRAVTVRTRTMRLEGPRGRRHLPRAASPRAVLCPRGSRGHCRFTALPSLGCHSRPPARTSACPSPWERPRRRRHPPPSGSFWGGAALRPTTEGEATGCNRRQERRKFRKGCRGRKEQHVATPGF